MALLAEELVEEWLNRHGYFTIRGVKLGVHEIDLLALRLYDGTPECRHIEVQASVNPVSYITNVPREVPRSTGRASGSAKHRSDDELRLGIAEWIEKKFDHPPKAKLRSRLCDGRWTRELVVHKVKHERELELMQEAGILVRHLSDIVGEIKHAHGSVLEGASGANLVDLVSMELTMPSDA